MTPTERLAEANAAFDEWWPKFLEKDKGDPEAYRNAFCAGWCGAGNATRNRDVIVFTDDLTPEILEALRNASDMKIMANDNSDLHRLPTQEEYNAAMEVLANRTGYKEPTT